MGQLTGKENGVEVSDRKTTQFGTLYSFSKRTTGFVLVGKDKADTSKAGFSATAAGLAPTASFSTADAVAATTTSAFRIGVNHSF
jgi:predicted porin